MLVLGGSQGARAINERVMPEAVAQLRAGGLAVKVTHQTGASERDAGGGGLRGEGPAAEVVAFIEDVATVMAQSSLVGMPRGR
ncbi:MAG: hypothetical protein IPF99_34335 [Deltaproteobacteria bacterium]|nr:hypothetical protein [Deltaproteobacteria bacterium]